MGNNIDIKEMWSKQVVPVVDQSEVFKGIKNFRRRSVKRTIILNAILLLTVSFAVFVWIYFKPQLLSTNIGIILTILPISIVFVFNRRLLQLYKKLNDNQSNIDYLNDLLAVRRKEDFMQTKLISVYFLLLSTGIGLYMYEYTLGKSLIFGVISYSVVLLWIGFNWFYLRPRIIRRNKQKIDKLIKQVEKIKTQL